MHVYIHRKDRALWISQHTKNRHRRLGRLGPKNYDADAFVVVDVTATDNETTVKEKIANRWYFVDVAEVVNDVNAVLSGVVTEKIVEDFQREVHRRNPDWYRIP